MSTNLYVLFIGAMLLTGMVITGSLNMNAYAKNIIGNNDDNNLKGTPNDDRLKGKNGDDVFHGYSGADYFDCGKGKDTIKDFNPSEGDEKSSGCEKVNYVGKNHDDDDKSDNKGKNHDDDDKSDNKGGSNSAGQGTTQRQYYEQDSQCVAGGNMETSCMNIGAQNQANTGNNALGQQGGSGKTIKGNSAGQGTTQGNHQSKFSVCGWRKYGDFCMNIGAQNQANTGNNALGQQGGSGDNNGDGGNP
ncbi:MAG: hypothetical protein WKF36_03495 [Candidatus Nitrosocosmicus sp.]